jgi:chemotaxis protein MotB
VKRRSYQSDESWLLSYADLITQLLIFFAMLLAAAQLSRTRMQRIVREINGEVEPASLESIQTELDASIERQGLQEMVHTTLTDDGLKVALNSGLVFDSGSAVIRVGEVATVDQMLQTLVPYREQYAFAVEGHTDSTPIVGGALYATNWELSTGRANAVRARLENAGVVDERIRVEGYADTIPLPEDELVDLSEQERLARHRRVIVRIY